GRALWGAGQVGVGLTVAEAVGPTVVSTLREPVQLLGRLVVAAPVAAVIHAPELAGLWMPAEADGVAQALGVRRQAGAVGLGDLDGGVARVGVVTGVASTADRDVEAAVGSERDGAGRVLTAAR